MYVLDKKKHSGSQRPGPTCGRSGGHWLPSGCLPDCIALSQSIPIIYIYIYIFILLLKTSKLKSWLRPLGGSHFVIHGNHGRINDFTVVIIRACTCWALFVTTLTNTVHIYIYNTVHIYIYIYTLIVRSTGPTWDHLGPIGPRWALCWPRESSYLGIYAFYFCPSGHCILIQYKVIKTFSQFTHESLFSSNPNCQVCYFFRSDIN